MTTLSDDDLVLLLENTKHLTPQQQREVLRLVERRDRLINLQDCRDHFIPFVKAVWPTFIPGPHHNIMGDAFERIANGTLKRLIINMAPRHKLLTTLDIPTTNGWKQMKDIAPGDFVFAPDGSPVLVTGKSETYRKRIYEVETDDGCVIETDDDHLWTVRFRSEESRYDVFVTKSSKEIMDRMAAPGRGVNNTPKLPAVQPVHYPEKDLPIDPYVLGAWLGDGASASGTMAAHPADAPHIRARFEAAGVPTTTTKWDMTFGTKGLRVKLRALGVLDNKHIPEAYLTASVEQRRALLQGLMDTDGSVSTAAKCVFHSSSRRLIDQVAELIRSFGVKAHITERQTHFRQFVSKPSWRISFKMAEAASLPRKAERTRAIQGNKARVIAVRETDRFAEVQCLQVANADGLFLAGRGYVVTHNTKSELTSWLLPAWFLGKYPQKKIIQASNTAELAAGFGRRVRNLISGLGEDAEPGEAPAYQQIFPNLTLAADSQAAASWHTNKKGEYFAIGVNGKVTGKGADIFIIDDPHSEQEAKQAETDATVFDSVYDWYTSGPRQRLQPGAAIIIVMTRWSKRDLTGQVLAKQMSRKKGEPGDEWEIIELPAILDENSETERSIWSAFWPLATLQATRADLPVSKWQAQYQQKPTSEEGAIIKRESWKIWGDPNVKPPSPNVARAWYRGEVPTCKFIMQSWDTANTKTQRADFSACTTWGIFEMEDPNSGKMLNHAILISGYKERMEFPRLKKVAKKFFIEDDPDTVLIEYKGSGIQLVQEFRSMGIPVEANTGSSRGRKGMSNDKVARANLIADVFASGYVWAPDARWAEEVMTECAEFPNGDHDDYVDSVVQAMLRFRTGGFLTTENDIDDDDDDVDVSRGHEERPY